MKRLAQFSHNLLSCKFRQLPAQMLNYVNMAITNVTGYTRCLSQATGVPLNEFNCLHFIPQCHDYVSTIEKHHCIKNIALATRCVAGNTRWCSASSSNDTYFATFLEHARCVQKLYNDSVHCARILDKQCSKSKIVAYKGVRLTTDDIDVILQRHPDTYVIQYVRDPRAIVTSRLKLNDFLHIDAATDTEHAAMIEAKYLCRKMEQDIVGYHCLKQKYPGAILYLRYEDVVRDMHAGARQIYQFLDVPIHQTLLDWIEQNQRSERSDNAFSTQRGNATDLIDAWRKQHSAEEIANMTRVCETVLQAWGYPL